MRTVEPSYPKYLQQYRYDAATGLRECQWNGPSWPFQTSQALTAMANLLDDYPPSDVTPADYLALFRLYTHQHFLSPSHPDLQEDYDPDKGGPIVGLPRSHHYNHSTYNDLLLSGLIGLRPRTDEVLEVAPLIPVSPAPGYSPIRYFAVEGIRYHTHEVSLVYDQDGSRYHIGAGFSIFVDGKRIAGPGKLQHTEVKLPAKRPRQPEPRRIDLAVNPGLPGGPHADASSSESPERVAEAIDGRLWFFPEIANGWSPRASDDSPWYTVHFEQERTLGSVELSFSDDGQLLGAPSACQLQTRRNGEWADIPGQKRSHSLPVAGGVNLISFPPLVASDLRVTFTKPTKPSNFRLIELKAFAP